MDIIRIQKSTKTLDESERASRVYTLVEFLAAVVLPAKWRKALVYVTSE